MTKVGPIVSDMQFMANTQLSIQISQSSATTSTRDCGRFYSPFFCS